MIVRNASFLSLALLVIAASVQAQPIRSVPSAAYPTIVSAAFTAVPGTIIQLAPGSYQELIHDFGNDLKFQGDPSGKTVIEGGFVRGAFLLTGQSSITDLHFRRCVGTTTVPCGSASIATRLTRCSFRYCYNSQTIAPLFHFGGPFEIVGCKFENCETDNDLINCGNVVPFMSSPSRFSRCVVRACLAARIFHSNSFASGPANTTLSVDNSLFLDNEATTALVALEGSNHASVTFCTIVHNYTPLTVASQLTGTGNAAINSCIIRSNLSGPGPETANCQVLYSNVSGIGLSTTNFDIDPTFFNAQQNNYRLHPFSVSIDNGRPPVAIAGILDLDGFTRNVGTSTDQGCYEYGGPDPGPAFDGTDTTFLPQVGAAPILRINGSDGGRNHVVALMAGQPLQFSVQQPDLQMPANFIIWGQFGFPDAFNPIAIPQTNAGLIVVRPQYLDPLNPALFTFADTFNPLNGVVPATLAPWVLNTVAVSIFAPFALQGIIENGSGGWAITNCVVVFIGPS